MTGPDTVPDADDMRSQLERERAEVAEQKALLDRMQRGRESQAAAFVRDMDRRYAALAEKERLVNQKIDVLDRVIAHLEASTSGAEKP